MSGSATLSEWVTAAEVAAAEVATTALACSQVQLATHTFQPQQSLFGAYVPLVASDCQAQIGVVAEWQACQSLARGLFGMDPASELEADSDVADALGEIANMIAGRIKTRMNARVPGLNTGLPLCVSGHVEPSTGAEHATLVLSFDGVLASVIVLLSPNAEAPSARSRAQSRMLPKVG
jgi:CheY-specific phosphatase CheX